jgi:hypothetical protein
LHSRKVTAVQNFDTYKAWLQYCKLKSSWSDTSGSNRRQTCSLYWLGRYHSSKDKSSLSTTVLQERPWGSPEFRMMLRLVCAANATVIYWHQFAEAKDSRRYATHILRLMPEHLSNYEKAYGCLKSKVQNRKLQTILHLEICVFSGLPRRRTTVSSDVSIPILIDQNPCEFLLVQLCEGFI